MKSGNINKIQLPEIDKELIYSLLFYAGGLLLGAGVYRNAGTGISKAIKSILEINDTALLSLFISRVGLYLSIFCVCILLSLCVTGFGVLYFVPLFCGAGLGLKISYYYALSASGAGYAALLVIPEATLYITVLLFTVKNCSCLSKSIYSLSVKKSDITYDVSIRSYLKLFLIYAIMILLIAFINSLLTKALGGLIHP